MAISVTCEHCGKALKVKDEWAGKRAKCPGCGQTFSVPAPGVAADVGPRVTRFDPNAAATAKAKREQSAGKVSVSWTPIILIALVVLLVATVIAFIVGPKKVWNQWEEIGDQARYDVIDVVTRGLQAHLSQLGAYNPRKSHGTPEAKEVMFYRPGFVMSMPDEVDFQGASTEGPFKGKYHPKTGEVEVDVTIGASVSLLTGKSKGGSTIRVTGRVKNKQISAEVNGVKAEIKMPPAED